MHFGKCHPRWSQTAGRAWIARLQSEESGWELRGPENPRGWKDTLREIQSMCELKRLIAMLLVE